MTRIGTGYVDVSADFDHFWRDVNKEVAKLDGKFKQAGASSGRKFSEGFAGGTRDLDVLRASLAGLDRDARKASKGFAGLTASFGGSGELRRAARNLDNFGGAAGGATATIGGFKIAVAALLPVIVSLGGAAVATASALAPLVGLAAAAGNGLAAAAQGFGVFKLATAGISDALKEQTTNQSAAGVAAINNAGQQRAAARAIQSAQDGVRQANEGVRQATDALTDAHNDQTKAAAALAPAYTQARMRLRDLSDAVISANTSLISAKFAAKDAADALNKLLSGPDPRELADAHRQVTDALRNESSAAQGLADAHRALNALLAPADALDVADAADAVADSVRTEEKARVALAAQIKQTGQIVASTLSTDEQKAKARMDLADAENAVGDAARQGERARQTLARLEAPPDQVAVEAARRKVGDAEYAVSEAARQTAAARQDLATVEAPATADQIARARNDVAQAETAVAFAQRDLVRATRELNDAQALGLDKSEEVVAARDAIRGADAAAADAVRDLRDANLSVVRANEALSDAQLSATEGMAKSAAAATNLNEKLNSLPPAAREFVLLLKDMKPRLDELRATAAEGFFPGATAGLAAAMGSFSSINKVVGETSTVLGEATRKSGELVGSPAFGRDIETIGGSNARVLDTMGEALRHVVSALRHVMVAAGPLTEWLAKVINQWALNAAEAAKSGRETGRLAAFFERTRAVAERLGSILGHLASGLIGVGKVGSVSGNDILKSIDAAAKRFDQWANSVAGRRDLHDFFQRSKELAAEIVPVMGNLVHVISELSLKLIPLKAALQLLGQYADEAVVAFIAYKIAVFAVSVAQNIATAAVWAHNLALRAQSLNMMIWRAQLAGAAIVAGVATAAQWALNAAMLANPIGLVILAIGALVGAFFLLGGKLSDITGAFSTAMTWIKTAAGDALAWLGEHWQTILKILAGPFGLAYHLISEHWESIKGAVVSGVQAIIDVITGAATSIAQTGSAIVSWLVNGIKARIGDITGAASWIKDQFVAGIHAVVTAISSAGTWVLDKFISGLKTVTESLGTAGSWIKDQIVGLVKGVAGGYIEVGSWALNRIVEGIKTITDALGSVGAWLGNRLTDAVHGIGGAMKELGGWLIDKLVDGLKGGANLFIGFVNKIIDAINVIPGVNIGKIEKLAQGGEVSKKSVEGFARGGLFRASGGVIDRPMIVSGEEAPRWPEVVIPSNPAYRDRARMLLAKAAGMIGFAEGGVVEAFATASKRASQGPKATLALYMAGLVESGMRNLPHGDRDSRGALQVRDSTAGPMGLNNMDPLAVALAFLTRGYWNKGSANQLAKGNPGQTAGWVAQNTQGSAYPARYDQVHDQAAKLIKDGGGDSGGILGAVGRIAGSVGDLLSKGAEWIIDKLPGIGDLPDWLKGTGKHVLSEVGEWIKNKVSDLIGLGGGEGAPGGGVAGSVQGAMALARSLGLAITSTTGGQHAKNSWHYKGRAADVAGTPGQMAAFYDAALTRYGSHLLELFYDPLGAIKNGKRIGAIGGHSDHVHIALAKGGVISGLPPYAGSFVTGGIVPGPVGAPRTIVAHGGESVTPDGGGMVTALREHTVELRLLRQSGMTGVMGAITDHVLQTGGQDAHRRRMTAGNPAITAIVT